MPAVWRERSGEGGREEEGAVRQEHWHVAAGVAISSLSSGVAKAIG